MSLFKTIRQLRFRNLCQWEELLSILSSSPIFSKLIADQLVYTVLRYIRHTFPAVHFFIKYIVLILNP